MSSQTVSKSQHTRSEIKVAGIVDETVMGWCKLSKRCAFILCVQTSSTVASQHEGSSRTNGNTALRIGPKRQLEFMQVVSTAAGVEGQDLHVRKGTHLL